MPYKRIVWILAEALRVVQDIQTGLKPFGYHVVLGGGVLNRGWSQKDLDLYFLPLTNDKAPSASDLMSHLMNVGFEPPSPDDDWQFSHQPNPYTPFRLQLQMTHKGRRVDVFIV